MKKLALAALVAVFLFGTVNTASAEFSSAGGFIATYFNWADNLNFAKKDGEDDFTAGQRSRLYFDYTASENLMATFKFEIDQTWGDANTNVGGGSGGGAGADGVNIETKNAYMKWAVPDSDLVMKMGIQGLALPSATYGSTILDDDVAAVVASNKFTDMFSATLFWSRLGDIQQADTATSSSADEFDVVGLLLPISFEGGTITPWGVWGKQGKDSYNAGTVLVNNANKDVTYQFFGAALAVTALDPITIGVDFEHGARSTSTGVVNQDDSEDAKGWFLAADISYKMDMLTASLIGFTSSGDDANNNDGSETMPTLSGGSWAPTTLGTDGDYLGAMGTRNADILTNGPGASGLGLKLSDLSFVENLTHTINLFYYKGTSKSGAADALPWGGAGSSFTQKDSAVEVNFESKYAIYENLTAVLDLGMVDVDFKKNGIGGRTTATSTGADETAYKGCITFKYDF